MFKKIIITAAVLAVGVSALAGCGCQKDSGNKSTADSASSSSEIISKDDGESAKDKQESSKQESSKQQSSALPQLPTEKYELPFVPV